MCLYLLGFLLLGMFSLLLLVTFIYYLYTPTPAVAAMLLGRQTSSISICKLKTSKSSDYKTHFPHCSWGSGWNTCSLNDNGQKERGQVIAIKMLQSRMKGFTRRACNSHFVWWQNRHRQHCHPGLGSHVWPLCSWRTQSLAPSQFVYGGTSHSMSSSIPRPPLCHLALPPEQSRRHDDAPKPATLHFWHANWSLQIVSESWQWKMHVGHFDWQRIYIFWSQERIQRKSSYQLEQAIFLYW